MTTLARLLLVSCAALLLGACSSIPFMGPGSHDLTIRGVQLDEVVSIYLIVGDEPDLADLEDPRTIEKVVRPERQAKYVTFAQFKPQKGEAWSLQTRALNPTHKAVEVELSKKGPEVSVSIDRELIESRPQLCAAVIVNCGNKGWGASQKITRFELESVGKLTLEVRSNVVSRVGASSGAALGQ